MIPEFINYQRVNGRGERLTIIGKKTGTVLQVQIATCLKGDKFVKKTGIETALKNNAVMISIEKNDSAHYTFKEYCKNFYKLYTHTLIIHLSATEKLLKVETRKKSGQLYVSILQK